MLKAFGDYFGESFKFKFPKNKYICDVMCTAFKNIFKHRLKVSGQKIQY